jgi:hypothetical protein
MQRRLGEFEKGGGVEKWSALPMVYLWVLVLQNNETETAYVGRRCSFHLSREFLYS